MKSSGDAALNGASSGGEGKARGVRWRAMGAREATVTVVELRRGRGVGSGEVWLGASAKIERGRPPLFIEGLRWRGDGKKREIRSGSDRRRRREGRRRRRKEEGGRWLDRTVGPGVSERKRGAKRSGGRSVGSSDLIRIESGRHYSNRGPILFRLIEFFLFFKIRQENK